MTLLKVFGENRENISFIFHVIVLVTLNEFPPDLDATMDHNLGAF